MSRNCGKKLTFSFGCDKINFIPSEKLYWEAMVMTDKVIDFHNYIFPKKIASKVVNQLGNYYGMEMRGTAEIENLLKLSKEAGMHKLVVHSTRC